MTAGCGKSPAAPAAPLNLTGTWTGQLGQAQSMTALRVTWLATHTGDVVAGVAFLVKPMVGVQASGTMTGVVSGDRLTLTYAAPPDSIPGFPRCEIAGLGNATLTNTSISGVLPLMFTSCDGTGLARPSRDDLRLTG
jgi:hypothetical protein